MSGRLLGETDERRQQCLRVRRQIRIAAKMLEHEIHERLHARGKMLAAHVVNEDARGLRHAFRQAPASGRPCETAEARREAARTPIPDRCTAAVTSVGMSLARKLPLTEACSDVPLRPSLQGVD